MARERREHVLQGLQPGRSGALVRDFGVDEIAHEQHAALADIDPLGVME